jgi:hypothetical protein
MSSQGKGLGVIRGSVGAMSGGGGGVWGGG